MNSLMKTFKSMKIVKMVNNSLLKLAKVLKIQPKILHIILGLLAVILLGLGLGTLKEGMTSSARTQMVEHTAKRTGARNDIIKFVDRMKISQPTWDSSNNFFDNVDTYFRAYSGFNVQNYLKSKDVNADGLVIVDNSNKYIRDNSGTTVSTGEKQYYIDVKTQDINNDGKIVAFRDTDKGNFYRDNSGAEVFPSSSPYILQVLPSSPELKTQAMVNDALLPVTTQINKLTSADDKKTINDLITIYIDMTNKIINLENDSVTYKKLTTYDPNDVSTFDLLDADPLASSTSSGSGSGSGSRSRYDRYDGFGSPSAISAAVAEALAAVQRARDTGTSAEISAAVQRARETGAAAVAAAQRAGDTVAAASIAAEVQRARDAGAAAIAAAQRAGGTGAGAATAAIASAQRAAAQGFGLLTGIGSLTGTGAGTGAGTGTGMGAQGTGTQGVNNVPAGSEDLYMLKTQVIPPGCPVGGCGTAMSSSGNISPAVVPESSNCNRQTPIPPCPPCERCPEPSFDCKRVPNYNSAAVSQYLPRPVLADFSQFGM